MFVNTWHVVDDHLLQSPPDTLYRVEHLGNRHYVFSSRAEPTFQSHDEFVHMKYLHADWSSRVLTPFLSAFAHWRHAYNWAAHRKRTMNDYSVRIHEIKSDGLVVFGAGGGDFLVLDEIPNWNVVETYDVDANAGADSVSMSDSDSSSEDYY